MTRRPRRDGLWANHRIPKGLTVRALARLVGTSPAYLYAMAHGRIRNENKQLQISVVLGVPADLLFPASVIDPPRTAPLSLSDCGELRDCGTPEPWEAPAIREEARHRLARLLPSQRELMVSRHGLGGDGGQSLAAIARRRGISRAAISKQYEIATAVLASPRGPVIADDGSEHSWQPRVAPEPVVARRQVLSRAATRAAKTVERRDVDRQVAGLLRSAAAVRVRRILRLQKSAAAAILRHQLSVTKKASQLLLRRQWVEPSAAFTPAGAELAQALLRPTEFLQQRLLTLRQR